MGTGVESIQVVPIQNTFTVKTSHNNLGVRNLPEFAFLDPAGVNIYNSQVFEIDGYSDIVVFLYSDVVGIVNFQFGNNPISLSTRASADSNIVANYGGAQYEATFRAPCRTKYARIYYQNGAVLQTVWEFSISLIPIGRS
jgi:hypothetical protein